MNLFVGFRAVVEPAPHHDAFLRVTASSLYRVYVNGAFAGHGPVRAAHEFFRVDEWDLRGRLDAEKNVIAIEVAGYNVNSYYTLDQPAFVQAELLADGAVLASTAGDGAPFHAHILKYRVQRVQRYTIQRAFSEVYRCHSGYALWRRDPGVPLDVTRCAVQPEKNLLPRGLPYPAFLVRSAVWQTARGKVTPAPEDRTEWKPKALTGIGPTLKGYLEEELETIPALQVQSLQNEPFRGVQKPITPRTRLMFRPATYQIVDFGQVLTGFIGVQLTARSRTRLLLTFEEALTDGDVDFKRNTCSNVHAYDVSLGSFELESFEPYTLRYLKLICVEGRCDVEHVYVREYTNPEVSDASFTCDNRDLNRIFDAGQETLRQNAVDTFMDCPSRERAAWLCDSFFTARAAYDLSGHTAIEQNFFENFLLPETFADLPDGMLPMCYPADHRNGTFIPNWALWFVVQLEEYLQRSGDRATVDALKSRVLALMHYFKRFKNKDGLLEKLESWVFVEWSEANKFTQDVNYPTNMLYAAALAAAGRLYELPAWLNEAGRIKDRIRTESFDGRFFVDNAVRSPAGALERTDNRTETCQYYAFFFDVATPESHPDLWQAVQNVLGPGQAETRERPDVYPADLFIGWFLRLEILSRFGLCARTLAELTAYFKHMAEETGTIWEHSDGRASRCHGIGGHVARVLYRDALGLHKIDTHYRIVYLRFADLPLRWCRGRIPLDTGILALEWWVQDDEKHFRVQLPPGYVADVENLGEKQLVRLP
ncbi:MAG: family 78 glycoside hydrolase catalytic domain [Kiritimatiellae bacterium]|nr:family 78 glycoside hydrolase catalytic domain [Kiritimatiellia bacterium]